MRQSRESAEPGRRTQALPIMIAVRHTYFTRSVSVITSFFFFFQAEDGIRDYKVTGVQTCALPIWATGGLRAGRLRDWRHRLHRELAPAWRRPGCANCRLPSADHVGVGCGGPGRADRKSVV